jgi:cell wall assembly regulator SMI1
MKIGLKRERPVSGEVISAFEETAGLKLPNQYREFLLNHNGAKPDTNVFAIPGGNQSGVNEFIPLGKILTEKGNIDNVSCCFLPVAWAEGGNYVCIDIDAGGEVFFWDHEEPSGDLRLAPDFNEFLLMLEPFDVSNTELKPGQVKKAWIDPDFLRQLKRQEPE